MTHDRVLLTGASGFIAKHILKRLLEEGYAVRGTVRSPAKAEEVRKAMAQARVSTDRLEIVGADLATDAGWSEIARDCRHAIHCASPFPSLQPKDKFALVPIARDGTLRVLEAARAAGIQRVVMTSSVVSVYVGHARRTDRVFTEADWSDVEGEGAYPYAVSKTLAEKAAWEFAGETGLELTAVNPAFVLGPTIDGTTGTSLDVLRTMMRGRMPAVPDAAFGVVDVRDVAEAHLRAMTVREAAGRRFLLSGGTRSLVEMGSAIARELPEVKRRVPWVTLPDWPVKAAGALSRQVAPIVPELGKRKTFDCRPAREVLGLQLKDADEAIAAAARSLREKGLA
ncbi:putative dihydroflavonol-4-reductase [Fulvimarina pelagi HTCC2506]|uniref:Putative dihydroflavonol-4-reductase n=1 Tax=Fulvimarina pelagi HTCC2506 TaxID=314231 RepID=Q0G7E9_9HYPH|nr:NAD-dependent epimerase/dehydratase family protein [Fulvimarina pelagi]EAU42415.1 putative dihydroflavonol-4-reductase [Fulvimarina pelagi HTCC2506]